MTLASGSRVRVVYGVESVHGTTPSNLNVKQLRCVTRDINADKKSLASKEMYPDRNIRDFRLGFTSSVAQLQYELSISQASTGAVVAWGLDDIFQYLLGSSGWSATGAVPSTPGTIKVGTTLTTMTVERQFLDTVQYEAHAGCIPSQMTLDFKPEQIIGGTIDLIGMQPATAAGTSVQGSGTLTSPTTGAPCDVFQGLISEGGSPIAVATAVSLTIKAGRVLQPVIGSKYSPDVLDGVCMVSGTLSAIFQDATLLNKFINETPSSMVLQATELGANVSTGRRMVFTLPVLKYSTNQKKPPQEGAVIQDANFTCLYDSITGTTIQIDRYL